MLTAKLMAQLAQDPEALWRISPSRRRALLAAETASSPRWVVALVQPRRERVALVNAVSQRYVCWLPRMATRSGVELMFPGFLFVLVTRQWRPLLSTRGISGLVMIGDQPGRLARGDLEWLRRHEREDGVVDLGVPPGLQVGDTVEFKSGRFAGLRGVYQCATGRERCEVLLGFMRAIVREEQIELVV